jgi:AraC-like DNA-binding protein
VLACPGTGHSFNFEVEHADGYMGFFPPGSPLDAATPEGYANATLTVPAEHFRAGLARHFPDIPDSILTHGAGIRVGSVAQASIRALLSVVDNAIPPGRGSIDVTPLRLHAEAKLLAVFLSALRSGCENILPPPTSRTGGRLRRLRQARDFIAAHRQQPLYLDDICTALNLAPRTVENLFRDLLGVNPIAYLRHQRLHGVRRTLKAAEPTSGIVKEVALDWGFWHLGRFSRDYRTFFGESPSETLQHKG